MDDEEIIVNGLYEIFSGMKQLDLDVYKAYSGEEAIEWLNRTRIDIVLTDIRMPEIDGLQLLEEIHRSWPQCKVIFLTGYNEFEYVYKAIQHNGVSYILKTEDHDKIISAVNNAIKEIQKGTKIEDLIQKAKEQMNMALELFQKDFFIRLLHGNSLFSIDKLQFEQLGVSINPEQPVIMVLGHMDNLPPEESYWDKIQRLYSVRLIISRHLSTRVRCVSVLDESYRFVLLIQPKELPASEQTEAEAESCFGRTTSFLKGTLEVIQTACMESMHTSISFVLSGKSCRWEDISKKYYTLNQLLNYRIGTGIEMLLTDSEFKYNIVDASAAEENPEADSDTEPLEALIRQRNPDVLETYLEAGQSEKFFQTLSDLFDPLRRIRSKNSNIAIEAYYKVALSLLSYINRSKLAEKITSRIGLNCLMQIDMYETWEEAVNYIHDLSEIIFRLQSEEPKKRADNTIMFIQKFIEEHLNEELSLVRLAEQVYLNPSYLSRLYKQVMGTNLSDFIDSARIKKAKELLETDNVKIHDVARMVGYETSASFTRFFRKISGCSPQEYQEAFHSGKQMSTK